MKLGVALSGVLRLALDTAPLIYLIENHPKYADLVESVSQRAYDGDFEAVTSVVTLTEVLTLPRRVGDTTLEAAYYSFLLHSRNLTLLPIDFAIADRAATLRATYGLRTPDALQIAAALAVGADVFLTNDAGLRRVTDLRILVLDDLEL